MSIPHDNPYQTPAAASVAAAPVADSPHAYVERIRSVAKAQQVLNVAMLPYLLTNFAIFLGPIIVRNDLSDISPLIFLPLIICVMGFVVFAVARMGYAMHGVGHAIFYSVAMIIPCLGLVFLVLLNSRVTAYLSRNGVKVGLMGADNSTIP